MIRTTIVGQAPGATNGHRHAFEGPCERRLASLAGLEAAQLRGRARLVNLLRDFPGKLGKGDAFPAPLAREGAGRIRLGGVTLLAGHRVARAFGVDAPYFEWVALRRGRAAVIPHPSGVSHWWNDPGNVAAARAFLLGVFA